MSYLPPAYYPPYYGMPPPLMYPPMGLPYYPGHAFPPVTFAPPLGTLTVEPRTVITLEKPKLIYFNARGRAEIIRLIFAFADVDYDDVRFAPNEDNDVNPSRPNDEFMKFKESGDSITGQVPYLEIDGLKLVQSMAIARYLAGRFHLFGTGSELHCVAIDMIVDTVQDLRENYVKGVYEKDEARKATLTSDFWTTGLVKYATILEKFLDENLTHSGFFVGDRLTLADLVVFDAWSMLMAANPEATAPFVKLAAHSATVAAVPQIAEWIAERPETAF